MAIRNDIIFLTRNAIDNLAWNTAIQNSQTPLIYAHTKWLDAISPKWSALVYKDYKAVMPITTKKKYGIAYLAQPAFTQQLGIFHTLPYNQEIITAFIEKAVEKFSFAEIFVNNTINNNTNSKPFVNYILPLNKEYEAIRKEYSNSMIKNSLPIMKKYPFVYNTNSQLNLAFFLYEKYILSNSGIAKKEISKFKKLAINLERTGEIITRSVHLNNKNPLAIALLAKDTNRLYNLISVTTPDGRLTEANHFLYDSLIKEFSGNDIVLDFEGSSLPGVAHFYKKFGSQTETYTFLKWNHLSWPLRLFKK
ncbi:MAG: hypothetical protein ACK5NK_11310 [Niabella sp.]